MEEIKHTPGPWDTHFSGYGIAIVDHVDGGSIAAVWPESLLNKSLPMEANSRLIAAAPDLLEALILLEAEMVLSGNAGSTGYGWKPAIEKTRAAIAKAIGAQP